MITITPARYKKFPSLTNPVLSRTPENQQIVQNLKEIYDNHSKYWDERTRCTIIDYILNRDTEVTERIARSPHRHKLLQRNMTFAIWIVLRATYGLKSLARLQYRLIEKYPGVDPASFVSPALETKTGSRENGDEEEDNALTHPAPPLPPPRAPSIFGPVDVSKFTYRHEQDDSQKRKRLDDANFQPWKIPKITVKREPDTVNVSTALRPPALSQVHLLPTRESRNMASPVDNAPLPSIESPYGSLDSEHENSLSQQDKENCIPPLRPSFKSPAQASRSVQSIESGNIGPGPSLSSSQIPSLLEQCRKFDAKIRKLQTGIDKMRKERQEERQSFVETITSIRDEIRADIGCSRESTILTKTAKVNTAMTEYNNAVGTLRASLSNLATELGEKPEQDKPSLDLKKTVDDLNKSIGAVGTIFEARQQEFRSQVKALDETTDRS
ncbi:hypothetical protein FVEN_g8412 [Fusarium venenatum]|uniref:Uncharacterized protein n=1 Tax=Fusarium venenatum TaxID=56646 RepID=A0A2L2T6E6_9HYPO|nr:uncharacterized protein FVRRES_02906 [Fusarium venenatum]KAG8353645.1 hypothetical protein FVEN_g8412 [Fusarium venenatum]KAH7004025.1 hypothetical protein EDB82DRAFT_520062 [Fusarium venenatum]CEI66394.1 unnamed protein product [Fusarium venenatum]